MSIIKKIAPIFSILILILSLWYFFVKTNDFEVVINAKTSPGTIYKSVLKWNKGLNKSNVSTDVTESEPFSSIIHTYNFEDYALEMDWKMDNLNDSITKVSIGINDLKNSLGSRFKKLLGISPVEELLDQEFSGFNTVLTSHLNDFSVKIDGEETTPASFVAYINITCDQSQKAFNMINNSSYINSFLKKNGFKIISNPFLEILDWDKKTGQLNFNFCFPIQQRNEMPLHESIKYKMVTAKKSLKATFHGNYTYTDEAWYALHEYIQDHQLKTANIITEIFYENPHVAAEKDINWEAAIYMEIE